MSDASPTPAAVTPAKAGASPADAPDWARPYALRQLELLGELAELGLDVARAVERQASGRAEAPAAPVVQGPIFKGDFALAYARVSRAVRLTLMLQARLIEELKAADAGRAPARAEAAADSVRSSPEDQRKARVERIVERLAEAEYPDDEDQVSDLLREAAERLDDEDLFGDLMDRPLSELVARLCQQLDLEPRWAELAQELWAVREVASGQPGWPLAAYLPREAGGGGPPVAERGVEGESGRAGGLYAGLSEHQRLQRGRAQLDAATAILPNSS